MKLALVASAVVLALGFAFLWVSHRLAGFAPPPGAVRHAIGGTTLYAIDEGSGDRAIVLVHGGGGWRRTTLPGSPRWST